MALNKDTKKKRLLSLLTHVVLIALTTVIIVWSLPRKSHQLFDYKINMPWMWKTLTADFAFDIIRPDKDIEAEKERLIREFKPFFILNEETAEKTISQLEEIIIRDTTNTLAPRKAAIEEKIRKLYREGVMSDADYEKYSNIHTDIRIITDNTDSTFNISSVLTEKKAYYEIFLNDEQLASKEKILNSLNLQTLINSNLTYDEERNSIGIDELTREIPTSLGRVEKSEKIIDRGEVVTPLTHLKIQSLEEKIRQDCSGKDDQLSLLLGQGIYVLIFVTLFAIYLIVYRPNFYEKPRNILMLFFIIIIFPIMVSLMMRNTFFNIYILPFAIVPMIVQVFLDSRTAFVTYVTTLLISAIAVRHQYEFLAIEMAGGMAAIYSLNDMSKRSQLFMAAIMATMSSAIIYYAINMIQNDEIKPNDLSMYAYLATSGVLLLLAYPLMYLIEKIFGFISNITYFELSDTNQELLRMLSEKAPGTFAHSATVGNLASEIAKRIGANALLVRTGALYHDIGKMENPVFFSENQAGVNPHDKLPEKESARIIISHVTEGQRLAEKYNLPDAIKSFILTHHGRGATGFFYVKYKNEHPDEEVDISSFSYPGPNPQTREQAILMMADTVEAATKSLETYNDEIITQKVNQLIDRQVENGFFEECPITFRDITTAKQVLIERLKSIYHTRIQYPQLKAKE